MPNRNPAPTPENSAKTEVVLEPSHSVEIDPMAVERVVELVKSHYSAPIPPTSELENLNRLGSGPGLEIVSDYLAQRAHDRQTDLQAIELTKQDYDRRDGWLHYAQRGQTLGALSLFVFLGAAIYAMLLGNTVVAIAFVSAAIVGAVAKLIEGRANTTQAEEKKTE